MLLKEERDRVGEVSQVLGDQLHYTFEQFQEDDLIPMYKSLANVASALASKSKIGTFTYREQVEKLSKDEVEKAVINMLVQLIQTGAHGEFEQENRLYRTSDLANAMGVTQATISNWIKSGRLIGVEKAGKGKHAMIPESAAYYSVTRERFSVREIMNSYEETLQNYNNLSKETTDESYKKINAHYIRKYKGNFFETLAKKKELSSEESRDKAEWEYVMKEMDLFYGKKK